jgi:hypothetical protein
MSLRTAEVMAGGLETKETKLSSLFMLAEPRHYDMPYVGLVGICSWIQILIIDM